MNRYQIFGSESSIDCDIAVMVDEILPTVKENDQLIDQYASEISSDKELNINLIVVNDGIVVDCYKGTPDEINNSLYVTYEYHEQVHPNMITRMVDRDVNLKIVRTLRVLLTFLSRTQYREKVKYALKHGTTLDRFNVLGSIDFATITEFGKKQSDIDVMKTFAFQLGQTIGLMDGIELYSKEDISDQYPPLTLMLQRKFQEFHPFVIFVFTHNLFLTRLDPIITEIGEETIRYQNKHK